MLDLAAPLLARIRSGARVAVVTVTRVARSAPRGLGASMAVTTHGEVIGSISGGCVEGDAVVLAHAVLADGVARTARFGFDDDTAHAAGLACGGQVDVIAYVVDPADIRSVDALRRAADGEAVSVGIALADGRLVDAGDLADPAGFDAAALLAETRVVSGPEPVLVVSRAPRPRLVLAGATEHAAALCRIASAAGFAVTVVDPWELLVTRERFPDADELVVALPHEHLARRADLDPRTAVCVLTHDTRLDVPAIRVALDLPIGFVGALGARTTVARRAELLREEGVADDDLARLRSPLGLDLGGSTPEETAVSIVAEILAARHGGTGRPLRALGGPIHRDRPVAEACARRIDETRPT
ncbi:XdhC family protein [Microbacterium gilvum]|uniref:XdhC family protein n=1 Tax=Microbacterium gilvum TaxID=1336204 RepID=A0ABP8ZZL6_9MICO